MMDQTAKDVLEFSKRKRQECYDVISSRQSEAEDIEKTIIELRMLEELIKYLTLKNELWKQ